MRVTEVDAGNRRIVLEVTRVPKFEGGEPIFRTREEPAAEAGGETAGEAPEPEAPAAAPEAPAAEVEAPAAEAATTEEAPAAAAAETPEATSAEEAPAAGEEALAEPEEG